MEKEFKTLYNLYTQAHGTLHTWEAVVYTDFDWLEKLFRSDKKPLSLGPEFAWRGSVAPRLWLFTEPLQ